MFLWLWFCGVFVVVSFCGGVVVFLGGVVVVFCFFLVVFCVFVLVWLCLCGGVVVFFVVVFAHVVGAAPVEYACFCFTTYEVICMMLT